MPQTSALTINLVWGFYFKKFKSKTGASCCDKILI
jgi:hypothetical protein